MRILFLALTFPKIGNGGNLYTDLMEEFRDQGHEVFVVAPSINESETGLIDEEGIKVLRVKTMSLLNVGVVQKGLANLLLPFQYKKAINKHLKSGFVPDLIIMPTPPISLVTVASWLKKKSRAKVYLILRDIFPQNAVDLGMIKKGGFLYRIFRQKERNLYEVSDAIGCMSQGNIDYVKKYNPEVEITKLHLLPNWQKRIFLNPENRYCLRKKYGFDNRFVVIFGGNIGLPQKLENILEVAKLYNEDDNVLFFIVGQGTEKARIDALSKQMNLKNVIVKDSLPREDYQNIISAADCGLISLSEKFTIPNIPSKSLSYFNAKIPVLAAIDKNTDYGFLIQEQIKGGVWAPSNEPLKIKEKIDFLKANPQLCTAMGENGYEYFINEVTPKHSYERIMNHV